MTFSATNPWFDVPVNPTPWLFDGLFPISYSSIIGKPRAGKSTFVRNLIVSVIKSKPFIGRSTPIPAGTGRVLYIHLDRKDSNGRVIQDLRELGITKEESKRLTLKVAEDIQTDDYDERLQWLQKEVQTANPHMIVIDLLWQFVIAKNSNDYNAVLKGLNKLQDALREIKFEGALIVTMHGRKATSATDPFDDALGSTGQRGSFSTNIMLTRHRMGPLEGQYTIMSDQTEREDIFGEIEETVLQRNPDGSLSLGQPVKGIIKDAKKAAVKDDKERLLAFLTKHPMSDTDSIMKALNMSKNYFLKIIKDLDNLVKSSGEGKKGDPYLYFIADLTSDHEPTATGTTIAAQQSTKEFCNAFSN